MTFDSQAKAMPVATRRRVVAGGVPGRTGGAIAPPAGAGNAPPPTRDEPSASPAAVPTVPMRQAYRDLARGVADTDRGAEVGRTYAKLKR